MTESQPTDTADTADTADTDTNLIDGKTGDDVSDKGAADTVLITDDEAQQDEGVARPGNS